LLIDVLLPNLVHNSLELLLGLFICNHVEKNGGVDVDFRALFSENSLCPLKHAQDFSGPHATIIIIVAQLKHYYHKLKHSGTYISSSSHRPDEQGNS